MGKEEIIGVLALSILLVGGILFVMNPSYMEDTFVLDVDDSGYRVYLPSKTDDPYNYRNLDLDVVSTDSNTSWAFKIKITVMEGDFIRDAEEIQVMKGTTYHVSMDESVTKIILDITGNGNIIFTVKWS